MASEGTFFTVEKKTTLGSTYYLHIEFDSTEALEGWVEWLEKTCELFAIDPEDLPFGNGGPGEAPVKAPAKPAAGERGQVPTRGAPVKKSVMDCATCGGPTWDNREDKRNPKAPDFKCRDKECADAAWDNDGELTWASERQ